MEKKHLSLNEQHMHKILMGSMKRVLREDIGDDDTFDSLDNEVVTDELEDNEANDKEQEVQEKIQEATDLAGRLYWLLDEICDDCRYFDPSFDEYELQDIRDNAETVMNDLDELFSAEEDEYDGETIE